ncbi:hypothetical protein PoB_000243800 [Plakobranchus ocellatus]|uniref:Uncharacterized protein n=1 Tax=Plakobranchus ocellatus TaxID=259542 RepID=A0AAV3XZW7_9GAST|nr:hypothetical protein PoB_000243800 [Plakobranchus ocellatus]
MLSYLLLIHLHKFRRLKENRHEIGRQSVTGKKREFQYKVREEEEEEEEEQRKKNMEGREEVAAARLIRVGDEEENDCTSCPGCDAPYGVVDGTTSSIVS